MDCHVLESMIGCEAWGMWMVYRKCVPSCLWRVRIVPECMLREKRRSWGCLLQKSWARPRILMWLESDESRGDKARGMWNSVLIAIRPLLFGKRSARSPVLVQAMNVNNVNVQIWHDAFRSDSPGKSGRVFPSIVYRGDVMACDCEQRKSAECYSYRFDCRDVYLQ